jgi:2-haloacid dehalogenase
MRKENTMAGSESAKQAKTPSVIVFDVNETLIDLDFIGPLFARVFGDGRMVREWFNQLILYSNVVTLSGYYEPFFTLGQGVLQMLATVYKAAVTPADIQELRARMLSMPAHPDVPEGLQLLKGAGFRLVTLTNSPPDPTSSPLERAGLAHFFERQFTVDQIRMFKPAQAIYHMVAEELGVARSELCLVAAHTWDTIGAQAAGYSAALVARAGNAPLLVPGLPQPQVVAPDLPSVARELVALWRG